MQNIPGTINKNHTKYHVVIYCCCAVSPKVQNYTAAVILPAAPTGVYTKWRQATATTGTTAAENNTNPAF